ncbi:hypothetical protein GpartN1_g2639.t1 [Galdieria partita]|uniref:Glycolipid transfer protein domain-containing protein n=1 Tax=Galdieria partita TaxID=83374 RepID=A0A9C7PU44_9RHOD|nr:hypothetical protein GpartN1_g2639.t1 [Galdieria partita]
MSHFTWEQLLEKFEAVEFPERHGKQDELPQVSSFVEACLEMGKFFNLLGRAFSFVQKDIFSKAKIVQDYGERLLPEKGSLQEIVEQELSNGACAVNEPPSCSRTVLRLLWATHFLYVLVQKLTLDETTPLRSCIREAYDVALKEHHSWAIQKTVHAALVFLPSREFFYRKIGVDIHKRDSYMKRGDKALGTIVERMYHFYEKNGLLQLP